MEALHFFFPRHVLLNQKKNDLAKKKLKIPWPEVCTTRIIMAKRKYRRNFPDDFGGQEKKIRQKEVYLSDTYLYRCTASKMRRLEST